jgi:putative transposase
MTLWKTYYHLVWSTRDRHELIMDQHEAALYQQICKKANILESPIHAIGGMSDHLHLVVSIPPKLSIAEFVKSIKGSSSRYMNEFAGPHNFAWQREYAVFSLGSQQLEKAVKYVDGQKAHHRDRTFIRMLEPECLSDGDSIHIGE